MTRDRTASHLQDPPSPARLGTFPRHTYRAGSPVYRSHPVNRGAWWFSSRGGRFDLAVPQGTCYLAEDEVVTLLESWGGIQVVPSYVADSRAVSVVAVEGDRALADLTSNRASSFGMTSEVFTTTDYDLTQLWASELHGAGFDGIRYWARHDLRHDHACLAIFDTAGDHSAAVTADRHYRVASTESVAKRTDLVARLQTETGIAVVPVPPIRQPGGGQASSSTTL